MAKLNLLFLKKPRILLWILMIGGIHGIIYVFLIPPWQHYDEPAHFEYAWLVATQEERPSRNTFDQQMRRELAASMLEHDFFSENAQKPNLISFSEPIWIGVPQTGDSILYYALVSIPLRLISSVDIDIQLYVSRIVSLALFLVTSISAYGIACTLTSKKNPLRWMLPLTIVLLPAFTDLMTSVNNDVGAVVAFSFFLWGSVRMLQTGFSWLGALWIAVTALICFATKSTVAVAVPLAIIPLIFGLLHAERQKYAWGIFITSIIAILVCAFHWNDAANWQIIYPQSLPTRSEQAKAPSGEHVFRLSLMDQQAQSMLAQTITGSALESIQGGQVTAGAWIWAEGQAVARIALYDDQDRLINHGVFEITSTPQFFTITNRIPDDVESAHIAIATNESQELTSQITYFDGIVLLPGDIPDSPPECLDSDCKQIIWDDQIKTNLVRNASAESAWPGLRPQVDTLIAKISPISAPSITFNSLLNWQSNQWYFKTSLQNLLRTFWAKFGWGNVPLLGNKPYRILAWLTAITLLGTIIRLIRLRKKMPWPTIIFFASTLMLVWGAALMRGLASVRLLSSFTYIPVARYAYPAIIPAVLVLNLGWLEIAENGNHGLNIPIKYFHIIYLAFFIGLDTLSILSIYTFYHLL